MKEPTQAELAEWAQLWARRVALECPFPGVRLTVLARHPEDRELVGRGDAVVLPNLREPA